LDDPNCGTHIWLIRVPSPAKPGRLPHPTESVGFADKPFQVRGDKFPNGTTNSKWNDIPAALVRENVLIVNSSEIVFSPVAGAAAVDVNTTQVFVIAMYSWIGMG
jgi:hypothetical protein